MTKAPSPKADRLREQREEQFEAERKRQAAEKKAARVPRAPAEDTGSKP